MNCDTGPFGAFMLVATVGGAGGGVVGCDGPALGFGRDRAAGVLDSLACELSRRRFGVSLTLG